MSKLETPYDAGRDSVISGPNVRNSHFGWFGTPERTREWERGRLDARREAAEATLAEQREGAKKRV